MFALKGQAVRSHQCENRCPFVQSRPLMPIFFIICALGGHRRTGWGWFPDQGRYRSAPKLSSAGESTRPSRGRSLARHSGGDADIRHPHTSNNLPRTFADIREATNDRLALARPCCHPLPDIRTAALPASTGRIVKGAQETGGVAPCFLLCQHFCQVTGSMRAT